jgi:hypothetical protein
MGERDRAIRPKTEPKRKGLTMKKAALTAVLSLLFAGAASAGETGIINQSGPYEATMKFYAHPAHGFPGTAEATPAAAPVSENANAAQSGKASKEPVKTAAARSRPDRAKAHVAADLQVDP